MNPLAGVLALLLTGGTVLAPAQPGPRAWVPGEHGGPVITMSIVNWGDVVDIGGAQAAYAHLGANGPTTRVTVEIQPPDRGMHGFYGRLTAPDAFGGERKLYCGDEYRRIDVLTSCFFDVPMSRGVNRLVFDLQSASWDGIVSAEGIVIGGAVGMVPVLEARLPSGEWTPVPRHGELELRGEETSALRYRIMNTGDIPFRAPESCLPDGIVWPYQQLMCPVRSPRPAFALAGEFTVPIELEDPAGGGASFTIVGEIRVQGVDVRPNSALPARPTGTHR